MSGNDDDEQMVPNPLLNAIDFVISRTETAVEDTPYMDSPAESIGDGPAWTGPTGRGGHDDYLAPHAQAVKSALNNLVGDVQDAKNAIEPEVTQATARAIRIDLQTR